MEYRRRKGGRIDGLGPPPNSNPSCSRLADTTHGMGMAIGGMYPHVAHGQALAIAYPVCTAFTWMHAIKSYAFLSRSFNNDLNGASNEEAAGFANEEIVNFLKKINLYQKLSEVDMPENEVEMLAKQCMVLPDYENNPRLASYDDMVQLIRDSY